MSESHHPSIEKKTKSTKAEQTGFDGPAVCEYLSDRQQVKENQQNVTPSDAETD